jgi:hypothetical protein
MTRPKPEFPVFPDSEKNSCQSSLFLKGKIKTGKTETPLYTNIKIYKKTYTPYISTNKQLFPILISVFRFLCDSVLVRVFGGNVEISGISVFPFSWDAL